MHSYINDTVKDVRREIRKDFETDENKDRARSDLRTPPAPKQGQGENVAVSVSL